MSYKISYKNDLSIYYLNILIEHIYANYLSSFLIYYFVDKYFHN